ncbi:thiamine-monophosphate kinase [Paraliobacillus quinghaiensis]|uniref:Thiamine-monophosphate kinase n=1 Tax=Paraliobacillus quinghaiensis TaxID=470815 RepID=A0A917TWK8_9BACI|nr:thiamine-phosphate kinase [Paraliobacillus quinghaiensis]GGM39624.1 thiamine-monophosphate kinase [Paraliobacillus quinghaiensis]
MDEFKFIDSIKQNTYKQPSLLKGIGDDAAVFRQNYQDVVTAVDTFVENVHFSRKTMDPYHIGYRVLAANISDMAAMGATPAYYMISIVIPENWSESELQQIYQGMDRIASTYKMDLIGGDTVGGSELVVSITIIGFVDKQKARYRSTMQDGDVLFVTGTLGDAAAGLHLLTSDKNDLVQDNNYLIDRHRLPTPRVAFAQALSTLERVTLNDISDGIANEASELATASNLTVQLYYEKLPKHPKLKQFSSEQQRAFQLFGGEDFELVGSVPQKDWDSVLQAAKKTAVKISEIGNVLYEPNGSNNVFLIENGKKHVLEKGGYTHRS